MYAAFAGGVGPDAYESDVTVDKVVNKYAVALDDLYEGVMDDFLPADLARVTIKDTCMVSRRWWTFSCCASATACWRPPASRSQRHARSCSRRWPLLTKDRVKGIYLGNDAGVGRYQFYTWATGTNFMTEEDEEPEVRFNTEGAAKMGGNPRSE